MVDDQQTHSLPEDAAGLRRDRRPSSAIPTAARSRTRCWRPCAASRATMRGCSRRRRASPAPAAISSSPAPTTIPARSRPCARSASRDASAAAGIVRRWHHGRYRATTSARARELLTELMPAPAQGAGRDRRPRPGAAELRPLPRQPAGGRAALLAVQGQSRAARAGRRRSWAARPAWRRSSRAAPCCSIRCCRPTSTPAAASGRSMTAELARTLARRSSDEQDILDAARRWANDRRFQVGVQQLKRIMRPARPASPTPTSPQATISALCERSRSSFAAPARPLPRPAPRGAGAGQARQPRDVGHLRPRPDLRLRHPARPRRVGRRPAAGADPVLHAAQRQIVTALTALTNEGALYEVDMRLRPSGRAGPLANSLEGFETYHAQSAWTWEHMALTRARVIHGPPTLVERLQRIILGTLLPAARPGGAAARRRRHARPHRPARTAQEPVGLQASARRPVRHRLRRAVPGAASRR